MSRGPVRATVSVRVAMPQTITHMGQKVGLRYLDVEGEDCGVPGLAIHRQVLPGDQLSRTHWTITHLASGHAVTFSVKGAYRALRLARVLRPICDWTQAKPSQELSARVRAALVEVCGEEAVLRVEAGFSAPELESQG